jgi:hypothetical protein
VSAVTRNQRLVVIAVVVIAAAECLYWLIAGGLWYEFRTFYSQGDAAVIAERTRNAYLLFVWSGVNVAATLAYAFRWRSWGRVPMAAVQAGNIAYGLWWSVPLALSAGQLESADWVLLQPAAAAALLVLLYAQWRR